MSDQHVTTIHNDLSRSFYWQFNYDSPGQTGLFLQSHFEYFFVTSFLSSMFTSHSSCNNRVFEVAKIVLTFFMMSEARWAAVENVVSFSKRSIVIKLPVVTKSRKYVGIRC